jgi:hypothetical protein
MKEKNIYLIIILFMGISSFAQNKSKENSKPIEKPSLKKNTSPFPKFLDTNPAYRKTIKRQFQYVKPTQLDVLSKNNELFAVLIDGEMGLIDKDSILVIPALYDLTSNMPGFIASQYILSKNKKLGVINMFNQEILPFEFDEIRGSGRNGRDQFYFTKKNGQGTHFDIYGNEVFGNNYDEFNGTNFTVELFNTCFRIKKNNKYGLIDLKSKISVPIEFDKIDPIYIEDSTFLFIGEKNGKKNLYDIYNKVYFKNDYEYLSANIYSKDENNKMTFGATLNGKHGIINIDDQVIVPFEFNIVYGTICQLCKEANGLKNYYTIGLNNGKGIYDSQKKEIVCQPKWNDITAIIQGVFKVEFTDKNGKRVERILINDKIIGDVDYQSIYTNPEGNKVVCVKDSLTHNFNLETLTFEDNSYEKLSPLNLPPLYGHIIRKNGKLGVIDKNGRITIEPKYSNINWTSNRLLNVFNNKKVGLMSFSGDIIEPVQNDEMIELGNIAIAFKKDGLWKIIYTDDVRVSPLKTTTLSSKYLFKTVSVTENGRGNNNHLILDGKKYVRMKNEILEIKE